MEITVDQMYNIENKGHEMGFLKKFMMENAGSAAVRRLLEKIGNAESKNILIFVGLGNNGREPHAGVARQYVRASTRPRHRQARESSAVSGRPWGCGAPRGETVVRTAAAPGLPSPLLACRRWSR